MKPRLLYTIIALLIGYNLIRRFVPFLDPITDKISDTMPKGPIPSRIRSAAIQRLRRNFSAAHSELLADFLVQQTKHETANYTSRVFKENNNVCGYKHTDVSIYIDKTRSGRKSPEGNNYAAYKNIEDSARELADWIGRRRASFDRAVTHLQYATALKTNGFYTDSIENYVAGLIHYSKTKTV